MKKYGTVCPGLSENHANASIALVGISTRKNIIIV
jgi:hypothetical protein